MDFKIESESHCFGKEEGKEGGQALGGLLIYTQGDKTMTNNKKLW